MVLRKTGAHVLLLPVSRGDSRRQKERDMPTEPPNNLQQLHRAVLLRDDSGTTDGQLLECFVNRLDEAAFEALVRRHGPMVLGVCQRVLGNVHDADDAFQATFLVLVRKAAGLRQRELLANWLYGVAHRTALEAKTVAARRHRRERQVSAMPEPEAPPTEAEELRPHLDRELSGLPDKYREALVLCDLEGRTRREAASQLGIPPGTLSGRLTTARRLLAKRLARHGFALSGGILASAAVPPSLMAATVKAATAVARGAAVSVVSAAVAALTERVHKTMLLTKPKLAVVLLLAVSSLCGLLLYPSPAAQPATNQRAQPQAPARRVNQTDAEAPGGDVRMLRGHSGMVRFAAFTPDGKTLATAALVLKQAAPRKDEVILWDVTAQKAKHTIHFKAPVEVWCLTLSPDGQTLAVGMNVGVELRDTEAGKVKRMLPGTWARGTGPCLLAFAPDGKTLAAGGSARDNIVPLWDVPTGKLKGTLRGHRDEVVGLRFSPDGRTLASTSGMYDTTIRFWEVATGRLRLTVKKAKDAEDGDCWQSRPVVFSPNGKVLARGRGGEIMFWDARLGEVMDRVVTASHADLIQALAFAPDGRLVAAGRSSGAIEVWQTRPADGKNPWRIGDLVQTLKEHSSPVLALAFSPSGKLLVSGDQEGKVRVWRMKK
jgi:RNA polymerase sigma factor (sigma-70 family)